MLPSTIIAITSKSGQTTTSAMPSEHSTNNSKPLAHEGSRIRPINQVTLGSPKGENLELTTNNIRVGLFSRCVQPQGSNCLSVVANSHPMKTNNRLRIYIAVMNLKSILSAGQKETRNTMTQTLWKAGCQLLSFNLGEVKR